jgi:hypothetical protein
MSTKLTGEKSDKLQTIIKAANVQDVESIWTTLFAKVCLASYALVASLPDLTDSVGA